ncbi:YhgE/Pip domain-containing protein [Clostridium cibarium]|uniref:YhgE/Pip domain-containing protein n=1 Tax=Clostridium cibarium TaxID=2762247 RepID=A0ABR8PUA3_9CLOT|nr:YhgE/Pip domain-containing protein [Clostridium cibarium]MBD7911751.1 YhgE/Pip domain-containing protein [Clostridium cibarium]
MNNRKKSRKFIFTILTISVIAIILIPMLYSSIYLSAFWDTYGNIGNVPVAFVNMDKSVSKDGKTYNIGKEVEDKLEDNDKVKWNFVSYEEAKNGVEGKDYFAMIVIPSDFSKKLADSNDGKFDKPEVIYEGNKGKNYVFYQISEKVAQSIKSDVTSKIQEETSKALVDKLYNIKTSLNDAADGANKLQDGTQILANGSQDLSNGMFSALEGSILLKDGLKEATNGEKALSNGTDSLLGGLNQLKDGLSQKNSEIGKLVSGASETASGAKKVSDGANLAYTKTSEAKTQLSEKSNYVADKIAGVSDGVSNVDDLLASIIADYNANGGKLSDKASKELMAAKNVTKAIRDKDINTNIVEPLRTSADGLNPLIDSLYRLQGGAALVESGTAKVAYGTNKLASGIDESMNKAVEGTNRLIGGATELKNGSSKLYNGLNTATEKTGQLSNGLSKLNNGAVALNNGLDTANDGATKLKDGLNNGYNEINDKLKFTSDDMSKFISEPVALNENTLNDVKYYGEGLAPYFISLSLWLGGMFINLLLSIAKGLKITENKYAKSFIGKYSIGLAIAIVQALLLSFVLVEGLKIDTVNTSYFYLNNILISVVFFSMMYGVSYAIGIVGTPIIFIIFLLQLASSGGTFPIETAPKFFRIIGEYLPFTYSIGMLRMTIGGINSSVYLENFGILLTFMGAFLVVGFIIRAIINTLKNTKTINMFKKNIGFKGLEENM